MSDIISPVGEISDSGISGQYAPIQHIHGTFENPTLLPASAFSNNWVSDPNNPLRYSKCADWVILAGEVQNPSTPTTIGGQVIATLPSEIRSLYSVRGYSPFFSSVTGNGISATLILYNRSGLILWSYVGGLTGAISNFSLTGLQWRISE